MLALGFCDNPETSYCCSKGTWPHPLVLGSTDTEEQVPIMYRGNTLSKKNSCISMGLSNPYLSQKQSMGDVLG